MYYTVIMYTGNYTLEITPRIHDIRMMLPMFYGVDMLCSKH